MDWIWIPGYTHQRLLRSALILLSLLLSGCAGNQSILDPAGLQAERIAALSWWMFGGGTVIWLAVVGLAGYVIKVKPGGGGCATKQRTAALSSWPTRCDCR